MIDFTCPHCDVRIEVPDEYAGRRASCPTCNRRIRVPRPRPADGAQTGSAPADESSSGNVVILDGRAYEVPARTEGLVVAAAVVLGLSVLVFLGVGLTIRVYSPWVVAGLIAAGAGVFGLLLLWPGLLSVRRSGGRKTGKGLAFVCFAAGGVLMVAYLATALLGYVLADHSDCVSRLRSVHAALVSYADEHGGEFPAHPRALVDAGRLPASKLTCPRFPRAREGDLTYEVPPYFSRVDLRTDRVPFPGDLIILFGRTDLPVREDGRTVPARLVLRLDGQVNHVSTDPEKLNLLRQRQSRIVGRVLGEREINRQADEQGDAETEPGEPTPDGGDAAADAPRETPEE